MSALQFIPPPKKLRYLRGAFPLSQAKRLVLPADSGPATDALAQRIVDEIGTRTGTPAFLSEGEGAIECTTDRSAAPQSYTLSISPKGIAVTAADDTGIFYALQTLLQIVRQCATELPALKIADAPDYPVRGFYHDISRGKVPTLATLFALVEKMAHHKLNQLQLYVEHTFAFKNHPDIWAGSDPLTADDIRALDDHCARHHIELVPSLSTFGHFYTALVAPRKQHLNEYALDGSALPFSWWDRMGHYTLDCRQPEALALVTEMIRELRPLFRSKHFNLCCDETFDLGKGRNAAFAQSHGVGRLYVDFLKKLIAVVRTEGAVPMFWGDIVGNHPELVAEVPATAIALDWDYSADLHDTKSALFQKAGRTFYVCPGCCGWDRWVNDLDTATGNILGFAQRGRRTGAAGFLNTDWGDRGHINFLGNSHHGLLLGASASWSTKATTAAEFDTAFDALEIGDASRSFTRILREIGSAAVVPWKQLVLWFDASPHRPADWWDAKTGLPVGILSIDPAAAFAAYARIEKLRAQLLKAAAAAKPQDPLALREALVGARGQALMQALGGLLVCFAKNRKPPRGIDAAVIANDLRRFEADVSALWHARNRPSEYFRVRGALLELARRLDRFALGLPPLRTTRTPPDAAPAP
ncbi:MAG TPA: beta-N-acetylhexosaminidase [Opitutaceae bacterium]|nr:beta-N-acetylhexosaminidase [Opitutaceae bacterium]